MKQYGLSVIFLGLYLISCKPDRIRQGMGPSELRSAVRGGAYVTQNERGSDMLFGDTLYQEYSRAPHTTPRERIYPEEPENSRLNCREGGPIASFVADSIRVATTLRNCQCAPMRHNCPDNVCPCNEVCPENRNILQCKADRINPTRENSLSFTNSSSYNSTAYQSHNLSGGYCTGHEAQRRKFTYLADFQPDLVSKPRMSVGDRTWKNYIKGQLELLGQGRQINLPGVSSFQELFTQHPDLREEFEQIPGCECAEEASSSSSSSNSTSTGRSEIKCYYVPANSRDQIEFFGSNVDFRRNNQMEVHVNFAPLASGTVLPERVAHDPYTGERIPNIHTYAYEAYMANKVLEVSLGRPAVIPGYGNLYDLSSQPTYQQIIGRQAARDWAHFNRLEDDLFDRMDSPPPNLNSDFRSMTGKEIEGLFSDLRPKVPSLNPGAVEFSNTNGPYETVSMGFQLFKESDVPEDERRADHEYSNEVREEHKEGHAVQAYAIQEDESSGEKRICIADPNSGPGGDKDCKTYFKFTPTESGSYRTVYYKEGQLSDKQIGIVYKSPYHEGHMGLIMRNMIDYCLQINESKCRNN